ncbi:PP2C family protein-serine/threonine phosphatase [Cellulomonas bogoriensis]|uniref:Serine/threonine protein phosphatase n=1 Tax=Cellulomonas bogoriensis 69B4 = DSM 16987 TaxID=1386082 RepID=A0A0A0BZD8_9CELL|nr:PP2C family protein-serine/threonine phosphatase [Cellulomonas bogoriensis]KGM13728.1 serine/threonine protein phosphatase [Cellulomonas bogoriensis 69B4 = DSM 16987]
MTTTAPPGAPDVRPGARSPTLPRRRSSGRASSAARRVLRRRSLAHTRQIWTSVLLSGVTVLAGVGVAVQPDWVPPSILLFILLLGVFVLRLWGMVLLSGVVTGTLIVLRSWQAEGMPPGMVVVLGLAVVSGLVFVRGRERLGLQGAASDLMLVDLRDRLVAHGRIPVLPPGWNVDSVVRSAYAEAFSGDFVVASRGEPDVLELVLVDVSGKGQEAGVRSLLLSGAFGGLLGAMPREAFLPAANDYLLGQDWPEGFATAVHLAVDLSTSSFWVSTAGHPPAVHLHAGSGRVELIDTAGGPALGVVPSPTFVVHEGVLEPGDTLMLYTDGLVETPGADVELGIDRLMGEAERVVATRSGGADAVLAGVRAGEGDDRALILVHRE